MLVRSILIFPNFRTTGRSLLLAEWGIPSSITLTLNCSPLSFGVGLKKQLTSSFSLGMDVDYVSWNNKLSLTRYERSQVHVVGSLNLGNLFAGSVGQPRLFEVEVKGSAGWGHIFDKSRRTSPDANYLVSKWGLDLTYNFGSHRRWGLGLRPSVRFDLRNEGAANYESFNANRAELDIALGLTYRFGKKTEVPHKMVIPSPMQRTSVIYSSVPTVLEGSASPVVNGAMGPGVGNPLLPCRLLMGNHFPSMIQKRCISF